MGKGHEERMRALRILRCSVQSATGIGEPRSERTRQVHFKGIGASRVDEDESLSDSCGETFGISGIVAIGERSTIRRWQIHTWKVCEMWQGDRSGQGSEAGAEARGQIVRARDSM